MRACDAINAMLPYLVLCAVGGVLHCFSASTAEFQQEEAKRVQSTGGRRQEGGSLQARECPQEETEGVSATRGAGEKRRGWPFRGIGGALTI